MLYIGDLRSYEAAISVLGAALIYNLTTFEASAQGGIIGLVARGSQDVILPQQDCPPAQPNCETVPPGQSVPAQGNLTGLVPNAAPDVYSSRSCSVGQVLDDQSGLCVPLLSETAEEQPAVGEEEQPPGDDDTDDGSGDEEQQPSDDGGGSDN